MLQGVASAANWRVCACRFDNQKLQTFTSCLFLAGASFWVHHVCAADSPCCSAAAHQAGFRCAGFKEPKKWKYQKRVGLHTPAGLVASFPAAWVTTHKGRKISMIISGAMYMVGEYAVPFAPLMQGRSALVTRCIDSLSALGQQQCDLTTGWLCWHAGTVILVAAEHISMLYIGRVILGFGVGFAIQVCGWVSARQLS